MTTARTARVAPRTLHVVDANNLTGCPTEHQCVADQAASHYRQAAGVRDGDLIVVGSDLRSAAVTAFAWPGARLLRTTGTDAVDRLLLDDLAPTIVVGRVERVVIGSGDGIFAARLAQLRAAGVRIEVVAPAGAVSWRLLPVAKHVRRVETASACTHQACRLPVGRVSLRLAA
jgi:hypothetical protein